MSSSIWPIPTIDRPFGFYWFGIFDKVVATVTGGWFVPSQFEFKPNEALLCDFPHVALAIVIYYLLVFGGRALLKATGAKPLTLKYIFQIHNLWLTNASFVLLALMAEQLIPMIARHGLYYAICNRSAWSQEMVVLYYLNYLNKYYEFLDTYYLVLKQKKLTFLHTYHHGATALLCYTQLIGHTSISWVPITLNLAVHVVMYWYYFLSARGIRVWWKEWVTRFQILQFIIDLGFIYYATFIKVGHSFFPDTICLKCAGTPLATVSGCLILSSYLVLFVSFYVDVYKNSSKQSKVVRRVRGGVAAKVNEYVLLDQKSVQENYDSNTGSPLPTKRRSLKDKKAEIL
ncbi:Fatty acyl-CoA elongase/Polyunsaturated fatty acid specific elongation enzyme [Brettanomyces nanus]|uniref:Elongation of fatty acids protein n=1 Tax=Eeniella nana TaxID=13502 RepID=A0A875RXJ1_EENNA|nr:Fatty acyl-CoA elongase/Polyunsaturated fatty acid specific elongation enzyme [Brettanomyces nanus]QPG73358.1 Fatty acyl-CoA elongase/Polyunsaturated fatty acid specific elongation enzyme [Brettanomyces nanus]